MTARVVVTAILALQLADGANAWRHFGDVFSLAPSWSSPMRSSLWQPLAGQYKKLVVVLPHNNPTGWIALAEFAARNHMSTQAGSFARVEKSQEAQARARIARELVAGPLDPDALYVFEDDALWRLVSSQPPAGSGFVGVLDGFRILAPAGCSGCDADAMRKATATAPGFVPNSAVLQFSANANGTAHLLQGWSQPEAWGTWSSDDSAFLVIDLARPPTADLELAITGSTFLAPTHPLQRVSVSVNQRPIAELRYAPGSLEPIRWVRIPRAVALASRGRLLIRFDFTDAASPASVGINGDGRRLGLGLVSMQVRELGTNEAFKNP